MCFRYLVIVIFVALNIDMYAHFYIMFGVSDFQKILLLITVYSPMI